MEPRMLTDEECAAVAGLYQWVGMPEDTPLPTVLTVVRRRLELLPTLPAEFIYNVETGQLTGVIRAEEPQTP